MEINIKNETLPLCSAVCRTKSTFSAECDVIVPDSKPDMKKVLQISARPKITNTETRNGHVIVSGSVSFDILYLAEGEEKCVTAITSSCEFSNLVKDSNIADSFLSFADVDVSDLSCNIANCRKLSLRAALLTNVRVYSCRDIEIISEIEGACTKKARLVSDVICAHTQDSAIISDSFSLAAGKAPITEILKTDATVTQSSVKIIDDKAIVKGILRICVLYKSETKIEHAQTEISFANVLEASGIREDMNCEHAVKVIDVSSKAGKDAEGVDCVVDISAQISMRVIARASVSVNCVEDAYLPHGNLEYKSSPISADCVETVINRDIDFREKISLPDELPPIDTVYQVVARPFVQNCISEGGMLKVSGYSEVYLLYLSNDSDTPICSHRENIDFSFECDSPGCMLTPVANCKLLNISYTINDEHTVDVRGSIESEVQCIRTTESDVIYTAGVGEYTPVQRPSIIVSCVHSGRSLWDIAKEYRVRAEDILSANALENEEDISKGATLIIPK
ncbi:MAG: DUF3794 domain-containing protein [Clostridia bacterium]|nr:DUF3794 domain-containing protein [Clostridia bacterium]